MTVSSLSRSTIIMLIFFLLSSLSIFSQNNLSETKKVNLPPGGLMPLKFDFIDYSYKLDNISSNTVKLQEEKNFLQEFTDADLLEMKTNSFNKYQYYMKANDFYNNLSNTIKNLYTIQELWYIYSFDETLTNKLISVK